MHVLASINPEAGDHRIGNDPAELAVAFRSAEASWRDFPYYELRYAERGKRFCSSDTAWLVSLCDRTVDDGVEQIAWLGAVLSSRGMPRFLLEEFTNDLHRALTAAMPERSGRYEVLAAGARKLQRSRRARINDRDFRLLSRAFGRDDVVRFGEILVSAVADEADGIERAVDSIEPWACDPNRFPPEWIAAVRKTIADARALARR